MKKFFNLKKFLVLLVAFAFLFPLAGCLDDATTKHEEQIAGVVITCDDGYFKPNQTYISIANMYLAQKNNAMWSYYWNQAYATGETIYSLTVSVDGAQVELTRTEKFEVGQSIEVTKVTTYDGSKVVKTEYK